MPNDSGYLGRARYPRYTHRKIPDFETPLFVLPNKVEHKAERKKQDKEHQEQIIVDDNLLPEFHHFLRSKKAKYPQVAKKHITPEPTAIKMASSITSCP